MPLPYTLAPLRRRAFVLLSSGSLLTFFGANIQVVGAAWEMMSLTSSPTLVALVQTASTLPALLFALPGGALADRFDRRRVLITAQMIMLSAAGLLVVVQRSGAMTPWLLLGLTFLLNIGSALRMPVQSALASGMVSRSEVPAAVSLIGISANLGRCAGPGIGGILMGVFGAVGAFGANMICLCGALFSSLTMRTAAPKEDRRHSHIGAMIMEGMRYCVAERAILKLQIRTFFLAFSGMALWALLPLIAKSNLGGSPLSLGILLGSQGLGAIIAAVHIPRWMSRFGIDSLLHRSTLVFVLVLLVAAWVENLLWLIPTLVAGGFAWMVFLTAPSSTIQMMSPALVQGRVVSVALMAMYAAMGLGAWCWGAVAGAIGLGGALTLAAVVQAVNLALGWKLPHGPDESAPLAGG